MDKSTNDLVISADTRLSIELRFALQESSQDQKAHKDKTNSTNVAQRSFMLPTFDSAVQQRRNIDSSETKQGKSLRVAISSSIQIL